MDKATRVALLAIIQGLIEGAPDMVLPDALANSLTRTRDALIEQAMTDEAEIVGWLGEAAMAMRAQRLAEGR